MTLGDSADTKHRAFYPVDRAGSGGGPAAGLKHQRTSTTAASRIITGRRGRGMIEVSRLSRRGSRAVGAAKEDAGERRRRYHVAGRRVRLPTARAKRAAYKTTHPKKSRPTRKTPVSHIKREKMWSSWSEDEGKSKESKEIFTCAGRVISGTTTAPGTRRIRHLVSFFSKLKHQSKAKFLPIKKDEFRRRKSFFPGSGKDSGHQSTNQSTEISGHDRKFCRNKCNVEECREKTVEKFRSHIIPIAHCPQLQKIPIQNKMVTEFLVTQPRPNSSAISHSRKSLWKNQASLMILGSKKPFKSVPETGSWRFAKKKLTEFQGCKKYLPKKQIELHSSNQSFYFLSKNCPALNHVRTIRDISQLRKSEAIQVVPCRWQMWR